MSLARLTVRVWLLGEADEKTNSVEQPRVVVQSAPAKSISSSPKYGEKKDSVVDPAAPMCYNCGNQTQKAGSCYVCTSCGSTTGCS